VRNCRFVGPGEYVHRVSGRHNMLTAFVHFSPTELGYRGSEPHTDRWLVEKCSVANVDALYEYNYRQGGWQTGRPVKGVTFRNLTAVGLVVPIRLVGDSARQLDLTIKHADLAFAGRSAHQPHLEAVQFGSLTLKDVVLRNDGTVPALRAADGNRLVLDSVRCVPETNARPFHAEGVTLVQLRGTSPAIAR
jgi:hypothetical protein